MTPEQKAYSALFYEGLIQSLNVAQARVEHGEDSPELAVANAQLQANIALAHESIKEVDHPISQASWKGYLGGVQRFAGVGAPTFPREVEFPETDPPYERTVYELFYDELDGWMREFYSDLPLELELIDKGVWKLAHPCSLSDSWAFFQTVAEGLEDDSGNFGDGFSDDDRKRINDFVNGDIRRVAEAVRGAMGIGSRTWPIVG